MSVDLHREAGQRQAAAFRHEPWRLFLSVLPHIGFLHIFFNVYWLWVLGTALEEVFGHAKTAALIVLFGVVSMTAEFALFEGGVGDIHAEAGGGVMHFVGTTTTQWWSGGTLRVVPTFTATEDNKLQVSIDRVAEAG